MSNNVKKSETLGMPHGTASHRLRKMILFKYVVLAGDNYCFKCGAEIESVNDLSIEHKYPWEGVSAELFWNLENIAFSHIKCNVPDRRYRLRNVEDGTSWCRTCRTHKPLSMFHKNKSKSTGIHDECKSCRLA